MSNVDPLIADVVRKATRRFGLPGNSEATFVKFRENWVFRIEAADARYALRIHRRGYRTAREIASELGFLAALKSRGAQVPSFVATPDGEMLASVLDGNGDEHLVDLQRWIDDAPPFGDSTQYFVGEGVVDPEEFRRLGRAIAEFHEHSAATGTVGEWSRPRWDARGLVGENAVWGDPLAVLDRESRDGQAIAAGLEQAVNDLNDYGTSGAVFGVIHADCTPENVLVASDRLLLIDFDDFGEGWFLFDLASVLFFMQGRDDFELAQSALMDGYRERREVTDADLKAWPAMLLARGATYLGWAADRRGDETAKYLVSTLQPFLANQSRTFLANHDDAAVRQSLLRRRAATTGPHSPLFYDEPLVFAESSDVWLITPRGERYLDAYNNVPHVGHANLEVAAAVFDQMQRLNVHSRYLNEPSIAYAEDLLSRFSPSLDRVFFTNSGSEANDLALRIARLHSGRRGILISDFSYHGNTLALAEVTTGLPVTEPFGDHVRAIRIPDIGGADRLDPQATLGAALEEVDRAIAWLQASRHGIAAVLLDPLFSTEGLLKTPPGYIEGLVDRVRAAGGLYIADEVQSGFGRTGDFFWGHEMFDRVPDIVTLGKPMANGIPAGCAVTGEALLDEFGGTNAYFNTFGGNPVSSAAGHAVLREMEDRDLRRKASELGLRINAALRELAAQHPQIGAVKGRGLFFGIEFVKPEDGSPSPERAKALVDSLLARRILISRAGRHGNVLKIRPPLVFGSAHADTVLDAIGEALR